MVAAPSHRPSARSLVHHRAAIYCRVSSAGQEDNSSLETQEAGARQLAAERGWSVVGIFRDVHSGSELFERPKLTELRQLVRTGHVDVIIAHAIDRVSRNQAHLGFLVSEWDHHGVELELVTEDLANTPEGRLLQSVRGFVAEVERLKIAERSKRGVQARVASGKPISGGRPPYGLRWADEDRTRLEVVDAQLPILRRIFAEVLGGKPLRSIARDLTREGIQTPTGKNPRWEISSIRSIVTNPVYTGKSYAYRWSQTRSKGRVITISRPESEWVALPDGIAPVIITEADAEAIKQRLAYNRATAPRNNVDPTGALLRCGIARCGYCGRPLAVTRRTHREHMYRCNPVARDREGCPPFGVMAPILDAAVWEKAALVLTQPEIVAKELERRAEADTQQADLAGIDRRLEEIGQKRTRLARAIADLSDDDASAPLLAELTTLAESARRLAQERDEIQRRAEHLERDRARLTSLSEWCSRVSERLATLEYADKRMVLEALGVSVRVYRADHEPRWEITMAPLPIEDGAVFSAGIPSSMGIPPAMPRPSTG